MADVTTYKRALVSYVSSLGCGPARRGARSIGSRCDGELGVLGCVLRRGNRPSQDPLEENSVPRIKQPDLFVAKDGFHCEIDGERLFIPKGERVRAGHELLRRYRDYFKPADSGLPL
jgi:hypothetical protein